MIAMSKKIRTITRPLYSVRGFTTARKTPPGGTHPVAALLRNPPNALQIPRTLRFPRGSASCLRSLVRRRIFAALDENVSQKRELRRAASRARLRSSAESLCVKNSIPLQLRTPKRFASRHLPLHLLHWRGFVFFIVIGRFIFIGIDSRCDSGQMILL